MELIFCYKVLFSLLENSFRRSLFEGITLRLPNLTNFNMSAISACMETNLCLLTSIIQVCNTSNTLQRLRQFGSFSRFYKIGITLCILTVSVFVCPHVESPKLMNRFRLNLDIKLLGSTLIFTGRILFCICPP